mmetsp:Transcript_27294/g.71545  ORF Transcript_27294/g.71545 Transcript_27294/m.71545 type:complete len:250 (+) Transcript_27294:62-811(+)
MAAQAAAIQKYVLSAKNVRGKLVAVLIEQALSSPDLYVFAELLELPSVQGLKGTPEESMLTLLELFAFGTYGDYVDGRGLPPLNAEQQKKLRQLTIVTLAHTKKTLPYDELLAAVQVDTLRELEDLVIGAIYAELIAGKLDQKKQWLTIDFAMGRDLRPGDLDHMISLFDDWADNCEQLLTQVDSEMATANEKKVKDDEHEKKILRKIEAVKEELSKEDASDSKRGSSSTEFASMEYGGAAAVAETRAL